MDFFPPALQTTIGLCGFPIVLIACLVTLALVLIHRRSIKKGIVSKAIVYFLAALAISFVIALLGNWVFLLIGIENTQGF